MLDVDDISDKQKCFSHFRIMMDVLWFLVENVIKNYPKMQIIAQTVERARCNFTSTFQVLLVHHLSYYSSFLEVYLGFCECEFFQLRLDQKPSILDV